MVKFLDGPAIGVTLDLKRVPILLRAVQNKDGKWDALDQLDDTPAEDETITVYIRHGQPGTVHVDGRDKNGRRFSRWHEQADYVVLIDQPDDEQIRETAAWRSWCESMRAEVAMLIDKQEGAR